MNERDTQLLAKLDERMEQMKARKQDILAKDRKRKRQERTRRLIQIGALTEKFFVMKDIEPVDYENFLKAFLAIENAATCIAHAKGVSIPQHEQRTNTESTTSKPGEVSN